MKRDNITQVSQFVSDLFINKLPEWAVYHNLTHTLETVNTCQEMSSYYELSNIEEEILIIAGWFHDIGYIFGPNNHESKSAEISRNFLERINFDEPKISVICECIHATKLSNLPGNLLEYIICDSDLVSLGKSDYFRTNDLLKLEFELREKINIKDSDWLKRSEVFLLNHNYYTEYAKMKYDPQKQKNLKTLRDKLENQKLK